MIRLLAVGERYAGDYVVNQVRKRCRGRETGPGRDTGTHLVVDAGHETSCVPVATSSCVPVATCPVATPVRGTETPTTEIRSSSGLDVY